MEGITRGVEGVVRSIDNSLKLLRQRAVFLRLKALGTGPSSRIRVMASRKKIKFEQTHIIQETDNVRIVAHVIPFVDFAEPPKAV